MSSPLKNKVLIQEFGIEECVPLESESSDGTPCGRQEVEHLKGLKESKYDICLLWRSPVKESMSQCEDLKQNDLQKFHPPRGATKTKGTQKHKEFDELMSR